MEVEPIVGTSCAACHENILILRDGKNCARCGLAVHRRCGGAHRADCAGKPVLKAVQHDYDDAPSVAWSARWIAICSLGAALVFFALGMLTGAPAPLSGGAKALAWSMLALGIATCAGGYAFERSRAALSTGAPARGPSSESS